MALDDFDDLVIAPERVDNTPVKQIVLDEEDVAPLTTNTLPVPELKLYAPKPFVYKGKEYKEGDTVEEHRYSDVKLADQPRDVIDAVLDGKMVCPQCKGHGSMSQRYVVHRGFIYTYSGETCPHVTNRVMREILQKNVSRHDMHLVFPLKPHKDSTASPAFQQQAIDCVHEHWNEGILYLGPTGTGKTSLMTAQYRKVLWEQVAREVLEPSIYKATLSEFIREETRHVTHKLGEEYTDNRKIRPERLKSKSYPRVFIDEFDKTGNLTEFKRELIFMTINSLYEKWSKTPVKFNPVDYSIQSSQFVACTNMTPEELIDTFDAVRVRRIGAMCWRINYFNETIEPPKEQS